jgi:excisionase family DNA binding protein
MGFSPHNADFLLTVGEVARLLKVPPSWIYEHVRPSSRPLLPHVKLGKYLRFRRQDIEDFLACKCEGPVVYESRKQ